MPRLNDEAARPYPNQTRNHPTPCAQVMRQPNHRLPGFHSALGRRQAATSQAHQRICSSLPYTGFSSSSLPCSALTQDPKLGAHVQGAASQEGFCPIRVTTNWIGLWPSPVVGPSPSTSSLRSGIRPVCALLSSTSHAAPRPRWQVEASGQVVGRVVSKID